MSSWVTGKFRPKSCRMPSQEFYAVPFMSLTLLALLQTRQRKRKTHAQPSWPSCAKRLRKLAWKQSHVLMPMLHIFKRRLTPSDSRSAASLDSLLQSRRARRSSRGCSSHKAGSVLQLSNGLSLPFNRQQPVRQAKGTNHTLAKQDSVGVQTTITSNDLLTAGAAFSAAKPLSENKSSTAVASSSTAAATSSTAAASTDAAPGRDLSTAHKLRLSAEMRVQELISANASLQGRLQRTTTDLEEAHIKIDKRDTLFVQADKMRQRAEKDLLHVAAERNQLLHFVSTSMSEHTQADSLPTPASSTDNDVPDVHCFQQTSLAGVDTTPDQTCPQTPAKTRSQAMAHTSSKQPHTQAQTDDHSPQISAVHAWQKQLQKLQEELESKEQVVEQQAADITDAAVKMSAQQGVLQQLRAELRANELAALLFHVRLVPTRVSTSSL